jgi:hypothetical protein
MPGNAKEEGIGLFDVLVHERRYRISIRIPRDNRRPASVTLMEYRREPH